MSSAKKQHGTALCLNDSGTYKLIAELRNIQPPGRSSDAIDVTHHQSEAAEFIGGIIRNATVEASDRKSVV